MYPLPVSCISASSAFASRVALGHFVVSASVCGHVVSQGGRYRNSGGESLGEAPAASELFRHGSSRRLPAIPFQSRQRSTLVPLLDRMNFGNSARIRPEEAPRCLIAIAAAIFIVSGSARKLKFRFSSI